MYLEASSADDLPGNFGQILGKKRSNAAASCILYNMLQFVKQQSQANITKKIQVLWEEYLVSYSNRQAVHRDHIGCVPNIMQIDLWILGSDDGY
jgi:hypothetical protein